MCINIAPSLHGLPARVRGIKETRAADTEDLDVVSYRLDLASEHVVRHVEIAETYTRHLNLAFPGTLEEPDSEYFNIRSGKILQRNACPKAHRQSRTGTGS